jgi:hypothetical protein
VGKRSVAPAVLAAAVVMGLIATTATAATPSPTLTGPAAEPGSVPEGYRAVTTTLGEVVYVPTTAPSDKAAWLTSHVLPGSMPDSGSGSSATPPGPDSSRSGSGPVRLRASTIGASSLSSQGNKNYGGSYIHSTFASCVILVGGFMLLGPRLW